METAVAINTQPTLEQLTKWQALKQQYKPDGSHDALKEAIRGDLSDLEKLQLQFDTALRREPSTDDLLKRSYNPVVDRWHVEDLREKKDEEGLVAFRQEVWKNMETNLMERLRAVESYGRFNIKDGQLYSEYFPTEPMSAVMLRGAEYRKKQNSPEQDREGWLGELAGWKLINDTLAARDAKVGTKMVSLSPPGIAEGSAYYGRFVDIYELAEDEHNERFVKRTRIAVDFDDKGYRNLALAFNSHFFDGQDARPEDAWYLSHPQPAEELPFWKKEGGLSTDDFAKIYAHCKNFIDYYLDVLYQDKIDWMQLAVAFNAILNKADIEKDVLSQGLVADTRRVTPIDTTDANAFAAFAMEVARLGRQSVKTVGGYGCPDNKGIEFGGDGLLNQISIGYDFSNSVAKFGGSEQVDYKNDPNLCRCGGLEPHFHCPKDAGGCGHAIIVGQGTDNCPSCGKGKVC